MATSQSDTKWFKKGSKLPDGTTAKKSLVWNTKTGKRQTGAVSIVKSSGSVKKGTTVKYKAGANKGTVALQKGAGQRPGQKPAPAARPQGATTNRPEKKSPPTPAKNPPAKKTGGNSGSALSMAERKKLQAKVGKKTMGPTIAEGKAAAASANKSGTPSNYTGFSLNRPGGGSPPKGRTGQVLVNGRWVAGNSSTARTNSGGIKVGTIKQFMTGPARWDGKKWVRVK